MRTQQLTLASFLSVVLLAGCALQPKQPTISDSGVISNPHGSTTVAQLIPDKMPPFSAETRFAAGELAESQNNPAGAAGQYNEALKLQPNHLGALYRLGVVYTQLRQYPLAIDQWKRYVKATGGSPTAYADLGFCQELAGQLDNAAASYQAGIARDGKCAVCRINYGLLLARRGKVDQAVIQWGAVLNEAQVHYNLGSFYASQGQKKEAKSEFKKALSLDPNFTDAQQRVAALDEN